MSEGVYPPAQVLCIFPSRVRTLDDLEVGVLHKTLQDPGEGAVLLSDLRFEVPLRKARDIDDS
jgi:hypothetical protein